MAFSHLHVHTEYSLLDGSNKIKNYVSRVKELGMTHAAITDHGVMYGCVDFYKECLAQGITPVLGCEVYVSPGSRFDRETNHGDDRYYHLILLCENNEGYDNLIKIVSAGFIDGFYYKPRVDKEILEKYNKGLICLSACLAGEIPKQLLRGQYEEAKETALWFRNLYGENNFFLEIQDHGIPEQRTVNEQLYRLSKETGIPLVATNDVHYTMAEDWEAHDLLLCIQTGKTVHDEDRMRYEGGQYFVKSEDEMRALFPYAPEACDKTQEIAERCKINFEFNNYKLPRFDVPEGYDSFSYLKKVCEEGLAKRYSKEPAPDADGNVPYKYAELEEKLNYELNVIKNMGFVDYFLIVWDFIRYAREQGIAVGPGRGSAAGSIVSYTMGITNIDPVRYQLIFERFLNPGRVTMPDIDIDFCVERRGEVIEYVKEKYGHDCVSQIITFGTLLAKGVVRDVGRVLDMPYSAVDVIAKKIPNELGITLQGALDKNPELRGLYESDEQVKYLIDMSMKLEGLSRHSGVHAAGVVIAPRPMDEFVPLSRGSEGNITTQYTKETVEELGLLKMDFLGLRNLTVIQEAQGLIKENYDVDVDFDTMVYDDRKVFELISSGKTDGVFQLESPGMRSFMKELKPENLEDVIAGISLYRPGPMDFIPAYIKGKNNRDLITYDCPQLKPILEPTYGCIVYQEQVMQIVRDLAGFDMARSDEVRRYMSKKKTEKMEHERQNFVYGDENLGIKGCIANGISEAIAQKIYNEMIEFAKYAFNKSHAAAYAVVAYQTAWLKAYYPVEYMAALMTSVMGDSGKVSEYISHCRSIGIDLLPPSINEATGDFTADGGAIRFGLNAVKSVGRNVVLAVIEEREKNGPFRNLDDFIRRVKGTDINKRALENFIKAGTFDGFCDNRRQMLMVYEALVDAQNKDRKGTIEGQVSLFDLVSEEEKKDFEIHMPDVEELPKEILLGFEKEVLGIYLSGHPLEDYVELIEKNATARTTDFYVAESDGESPESGLASEMRLIDGQNVVVGGIITAVSVKYNKRNQIYAIVSLEDLVGSVEVLVFSRQYERCKNYLEVDNKVFISGRVSAEEDKNGKLLAEEVTPFDRIPRELWLQFSTMEEYETKWAEAESIMRTMPGDVQVVIYISSEKAIKRLGRAFMVSLSEEGMAALKGSFGEQNVRVVNKSLIKNSQKHS